VTASAASPPKAGPRPLKIGVSTCLLGKPVRYDGGHKLDHFLADMLGRYVKFVPVCPEVELGLGTPRETLRLVRRDDGVRMVFGKTGADVTDAMREYSEKRVERLAGEELSGYVLKKDSPSCGMERVKVYGEKGPGARTGVGVYAEVLLARFPHLPVEEEGRLNDPGLRDNFVERIFAYRRVRDLFAGRWTMGDLVRFHTVHKLALLAHRPAAYQSLGRLVAHAKGRPRAEVAAEYETGFMTALATLATRRTHTNVLQHIAGYFKEQLDADGKRELQSLIGDYHRGLVPLIVPVTLLRHYVRRFGVAYLEGQVYLEPHPKELMLRNHV
jgi:uncharacterized protein YbgA (DUF1722 family)/uncharacterized protein YbbK (DUF523 family)